MKLHHPYVFFGDKVNLEDVQGIEPTLWNYDRKSIVYALPPLKYHYSLLYFKTCTEDQWMKSDLTLR